MRDVAKLRDRAQELLECADSLRAAWAKKMSPTGAAFTHAGPVPGEPQGELARELLAALDVVEAAEKRIQARVAWASAPTTTTTAELDALYSKAQESLGWEDLALRNWRTGSSQ